MSLHTMLYGNTLQAWLIAVVTAAGLLLALLVVRRVVLSRLMRFAQRTAAPWDDLVADLLGRTHTLFLCVAAVAIGANVLALPAGVTLGVRRALILAFLAQAGLWGGAAARTILEHYRIVKLADDRGALGMFSALTFLLQVAIWSAILLLALENVGVNVTTLIAGFGVGGVAVALASQHILGDVFSSFVIVLDKPFVIGDFIIVGDLMGSVTHIGLKTTRLNALSGEQLIFSNSDLLESRIRNFGRMVERRVLFKIGVTYDTPREQLARIPQIIRSAIEAQRPTRFDRSHFASYGDSALTFESVYYVLSPDYNKYMDIQHAVNLAILTEFESAEIEFAFPTRTIMIDNVSPPAPPPPLNNTS